MAESRDDFLAFAAHQFELWQFQEDGESLRVHLESIERQTGKRPAQLDGPECPAGFEYLYEYFVDLCGERGAGMIGIEPLRCCDIDAWMRLTHRDLGFFEIEVDERLADFFLQLWCEIVSDAE